MRKDTFDFKKFSVYQKGASLKICTDSCLFGAWLSKEVTTCKNALDIGTGTGLLALLFAQQHTHCYITALEIEEASAALAQFNFQESPWGHLLLSLHSSVQLFASQTKEKFEVIFCNPPFFENQLKSPKAINNTAKHSAALSHTELITSIRTLMTEEGKAFILLPVAEAIAFETEALGQELFLTASVKVRNNEYKPFFRKMLRFEKKKKTLTEEEITICKLEGDYTKTFTELLSPYYLHL